MPIHLGEPDAMSQSEQDTLDFAFVTTRSLRLAARPEHAFVCGRKGSGKTTLALRLGNLDGETDGISYEEAIYISESDYAVLHIDVVDTLFALGLMDIKLGPIIGRCFFFCWKFIFEVSAMQLALTLATKRQQSDQDVGTLQMYLESIGCTIEPAPFYVSARFLEYLSELEPARPLVGNVVFKLLKLGQTTPHKLAKASAKRLLGSSRAVVAVDTMEDYDVSEAGLFPLTGLCEAVREFHNKREFRTVFAKLFLPAELTPELFRRNEAKFNAITIYIHWSFRELIQFIAIRFLGFVEKNGYGAHPVVTQFRSKLDDVRRETESEPSLEFWRAEFWETFMPQSVENWYGWDEPSTVFLIRHTQRRPREVLSCMNYVVDLAINERTLPIISERAFVSGVRDKDNIYNLLTDNLSIFDYVGSPVPPVRDIAQQIFAEESPIFSGKDFDKFTARAYQMFEDTLGDQAEVAENLLLRSGLVGIVPDKEMVEMTIGVTRPRYYVTLFEYTIPGRVHVNDESMCAVHPILGTRLGLKDPKKGAVLHVPDKREVEYEDLARFAEMWWTA